MSSSVQPLPAVDIRRIAWLRWFTPRFDRKAQYHYARIDREGVCISVWTFDDPVVRPDAIAIDQRGVTLIGKRWTQAGWTNQNRSPVRPD